MQPYSFGLRGVLGDEPANPSTFQGINVVETFHTELSSHPETCGLITSAAIENDGLVLGILGRPIVHIDGILTQRPLDFDRAGPVIVARSDIQYDDVWIPKEGFQFILGHQLVLSCIAQLPGHHENSKKCNTR